MKELNTAGFEIGDSGDDVVGAESDVLDAGAVIVVHESGAVNVLRLQLLEWTYSSIWDFFFPAAGSFIGILIVSLGDATTIERIAE